LRTPREASSADYGRGLQATDRPGTLRVLGPLAVHLQSDRAPVRRFDDSPGYRGASTVGPVLITVHEGSLVCLLNELFHLLSVGSAMQGDPVHDIHTATSHSETHDAHAARCSSRRCHHGRQSPYLRVDVRRLGVIASAVELAGPAIDRCPPDP
jgi:hypothetical protein